MPAAAALLLVLAAWLGLLAAPSAQAQTQARTPTAAAAPPAPAASAAARPRIGLVLSGGGARGLAHVGVLKLLEQLQVPVDVIAGTSMGAIVGGLYASGMSAAEIEHELGRVRWGELFASRIERQQLAQRRKEEDFEISALIELGWKDGALRTPSGAVSSRGLETLLRRYTLPVRELRDFDALPIPFRAVATDMETGAAVILERGDLALALRSSMSVPGVFPPIEVDGRVLGDGGLVNNLPVDVARAMGAERVIVVNIGTPLAGRDTLGSVVGQTAQMINILTEQNVQRSLASLGPQDLLIAPALGTLSSGDFDQAARFIALGEAGARGRSDALAGLSLNAAQWAQYRLQRPLPPPVRTRIAEVRVEGTGVGNTERLARLLESRPGQAFDTARAERDARRLAAGGDYIRADYQLLPAPAQAGTAATSGGDALVFELEDKPWGPNYLRLGLDMSTDFRGRSAFNLKLSHNRHWLTPSGTEWRNRVQIGEVPRLHSELYHPLTWTDSPANDWFVSGYGGLERMRLRRYDADSGVELDSLQRTTGQLGLDLGQPWGEFGELRLGLSRVDLHARAAALTSDNRIGSATVRWHEEGLRARVVIDQLDFALFPQRGYRGQLEIWRGRRGGDLDGYFWRAEAEGTAVRSFGRHTLEAHVTLQTAEQRGGPVVQRYSLGGFHRLSGYESGQLSGNHALLLRLGWYRRLQETPALTRGFFVGATAELGNTWQTGESPRLSGLRSGYSVFLGADTGIGPLYLGITHAPRGETGLALFIGRP
ncbi:MAG: patatin-like phospholipase family protein [Burkholderiaceae bacterium]|nr:patatin-like phospholipase family protein [Burkholderiaceae bacterium]